MNLKKKVIFGMVAGFFAVATVFNMSLLNDNGAGDVSLDAIAVMAEAGGESGGYDCYPWGWVCVQWENGYPLYIQGMDNYGH